MQNTSEWGIRAFLRDISVNITLKLHKTYKNHTKNANKIHTYQVYIDDIVVKSRRANEHVNYLRKSLRG